MTALLFVITYILVGCVVSGVGLRILGRENFDDSGATMAAFFWPLSIVCILMMCVTWLVNLISGKKSK